LEGLIEDILVDLQLTQNSNLNNSRSDKQNEKLEIMEWKNSKNSDDSSALSPKLGSVEIITEKIVSPAIEKTSVAKVKSKPSNRPNNVTLEN